MRAEPSSRQTLTEGASSEPARKRMRLAALGVSLAVAAILSGCTPAGPRALLDGDAALKSGEYAKAVTALKRATEVLPNEPRAWNLLGLAYHHSDQPQLAAQAYKQALARDRSNLVTIAHFNLGCLLLEQGNPSAAADELRSFTLITNSALGWLKLGTAQMRLRQFDNAERSFAAALRLDAKNAEVLNALGTLNVQRNRTREAIQNFQAALQADPKHRAAMLNLAVVTQQNPATRPFALQQYREYLAAAPRDAQWESVNSVARQLEAELSPPRAPVMTNALVQPSPPPKTNAIVAAPKTNLVAVLATTPPPTNPVTAPPRIATTTIPPPAKSNAPPRTNAVVTAPAVIPTNAPVTVVVVTNQPPPRLAVAEAPPSSAAVPATPIHTAEVAEATAPITNPPPALSPSLSVKNPKGGFFTRLNPFRSKPKEPTNEIPRSVVLTAPTNVIEPGVAPPPRPKPTFARYKYLAPSVPRAGNRKDAQRAFDQGMKALRAGNTNQALLDYQLAMSADPSFVDAPNNYALINLQLGELSRSLAAWESVLALEPDSINARYNFALTLRKASYPIDAAAELERILEAKPREVRAHLMLGNLCAQELADTRRARAHYLKVLELDPRNSQAATIRFWLAANR